MALALHTRAVDDNNKAYTAIQGWNTNPADIRMPDSVNTRRPKLSNRQIASRYLKSVEGNPNIDINKKLKHLRAP
jgi:ribosomal protein L14E/L6E/L27E